MTKDQLIKIAIAGFPERIAQTIDFSNAEIFHLSGVYRLYDRDTPFMLMLPVDSYLTVAIGADNFIQIEAGSKAFNHYAAIKEIERLGLIKTDDR